MRHQPPVDFLTYRELWSQYCLNQKCRNPFLLQLKCWLEYLEPTHWPGHLQEMRSRLSANYLPIYWQFYELCLFNYFGLYLKRYLSSIHYLKIWIINCLFHLVFATKDPSLSQDYQSVPFYPIFMVKISWLLVVLSIYLVFIYSKTCSYKVYYFAQFTFQS